MRSKVGLAICSWGLGLRGFMRRRLLSQRGNQTFNVELLSLDTWFQPQFFQRLRSNGANAGQADTVKFFAVLWSQKCHKVSGGAAAGEGDPVHLFCFDRLKQR